MPKQHRTDVADFRPYFQRRVAQLSERLIDVAEQLFNERALKKDQDFEEHVDRQLRDGAKFIRRKRQSG